MFDNKYKAISYFENHWHVAYKGIHNIGSSDDWSTTKYKNFVDDNCTNGNLTCNIIIIYIYIGVEKCACVYGYQYGLDDLFIIKSMCP